MRSQQFLEEVAKVWKIEDRGLFIDGDGLKQVLKDMNSKAAMIQKELIELTP